MPKSKSKCKDKCGERGLFNLGDKTSNKCKYFEPSELDQKAWDAFKFDKVDWICHLGHYVKGVDEGKAKPCEECNQTFDNRIEEFLMVRLRNQSRDKEEV